MSFSPVGVKVVPNRALKGRFFDKSEEILGAGDFIVDFFADFVKLVAKVLATEYFALS